jgi:hypothetical protein
VIYKLTAPEVKRALNLTEKGGPSNLALIGLTIRSPIVLRCLDNLTHSLAIKTEIYRFAKKKAKSRD